ncbi:hypothetical protein GCM10023089_32100 [Quisquiliibacterium transsilvanicum]|uniref:Uncharacterized protein n=1 Tax=Quisquiliibacterium transsilvanicum TaxID=1549638 RepID=A0A7W8M6W7_9BURK|nr:hypothetical protein [Quisquiliibacterium transsilvanicum]
MRRLRLKGFGPASSRAWPLTAWGCTCYESGECPTCVAWRTPGAPARIAARARQLGHRVVTVRYVDPVEVALAAAEGSEGFSEFLIGRGRP